MDLSPTTPPPPSRAGHSSTPAAGGSPLPKELTVFLEGGTLRKQKMSELGVPFKMLCSKPPLLESLENEAWRSKVRLDSKSHQSHWGQARTPPELLTSNPRLFSLYHQDNDSKIIIDLAPVLERAAEQRLAERETWSRPLAPSLVGRAES